MTIEIQPETERLIQEEIRSGHFRSVDEIIVQGVQARQSRMLPKRQARKTPAEAVDHIRQARQGNRLPPGVSIEDLIREGRA
jgi:hypothetical protein